MTQSSSPSSSVKVDPTTLLLTNFTADEAVSMKNWAKQVLLSGNIPNPHPPWLVTWFKVGGFDLDKQLLVIATVVPSRVLLSLVLAAEAIEDLVCGSR